MNATQLALLHEELLKPTYASLSHQEAADHLNTTLVQVDRETVDAREIIEATVASEYAGLTAANKDLFWGLVGAGTLNVHGPNTRAILGSLFGAATQTRANLLALQTEAVSLAVSLGLGTVAAEDAQKARLNF